MFGGEWLRNCTFEKKEAQLMAKEWNIAGSD